jgi:hypothetical protein
LLLPNVNGLETRARITAELSELELSNLMMATNRMGAVLSHLQGVVGDMSTLQVQEYTRRLTAGNSESESVATQVAERTLDDEFGDLSLSRVNAELEDFGDIENHEGSS